MLELEERQKTLDNNIIARPFKGDSEKVHAVEITKGTQVRGVSFYAGEVVERLTRGESYLLCVNNVASSIPLAETRKRK
jgi:hypothetical protein|tara:strand:- start:115 stop:351 length:237 start_codon:yes stop_codon:yes gene_type:complete